MGTIPRLVVMFHSLRDGALSSLSNSIRAGHSSSCRQNIFNIHSRMLTVSDEEQRVIIHDTPNLPSVLVLTEIAGRPMCLPPVVLGFMPPFVFRPVFNVQCWVRLRMLTITVGQLLNRFPIRPSRSLSHSNRRMRAVFQRRRRSLILIAY